MDIDVVISENLSAPRSVEGYKTLCLDLFLSNETFSLEVSPAKLLQPEAQLQHLALQELEKEGFLKSYTSPTGIVSYFLNQEIFFTKKTLELSVDSLARAAELYNGIMPNFLGPSAQNINALEVDATILDALISILLLTLVPETPEEDSPVGKGDIKTEFTLE